MATLTVGSSACTCREPEHEPRLVVLTGGPGAGKTAVLELARRSFCRHVTVLPEAAGVVFGGGFPRHTTDAGLRAAQRAIFQVQRQLEVLVVGERAVSVALCDRGTVDGLAYWPGDVEELLSEMGTALDAELARYSAVLHLRTPAAQRGYNHRNPLRVETADAAQEIDRRIERLWSGHGDRTFVESTDDFLEKAARALHLVRDALAPCCRSHRLAV